MTRNPFTRRRFVGTTAAGTAALAGWRGNRSFAAAAKAADKPALLGGQPAFTGDLPAWPQWNSAWEPEIINVLRSGRWFRRGNTGQVAEFESAYAELIGAKRCLATSSGTTALTVGLYVLGVDAGDEVIVSPYTFIATYNAILTQKALPVFADTDPQTFTIDPQTIESRITDRTRAILPVHIYGLPCDMDPIRAIARANDLAVLEDACQAWLAEYKGRKCGTLGDLGCFSFQNSKHLPAGEGGAITGNDDLLLDRCYSYHSCGASYGSYQGDGFFSRGNNYRMQHLQAAMLIQQLEKLQRDTETRRANAEYLIGKLASIPGLDPAQLPLGSRPVWHLFPMRYDSAQFNGLSREGFIKALSAEGVPCSGVYHEQYYDGLLDEAIQSRGFKRLFGAQRLKDYRDSFDQLTGNRQVCRTTVCLFQNLLLTSREQLDQVVEALTKIRDHSERLAAQ